MFKRCIVKNPNHCVCGTVPFYSWSRDSFSSSLISLICIVILNLKRAVIGFKCNSSRPSVRITIGPANSQVIHVWDNQSYFAAFFNAVLHVKIDVSVNPSTFPSVPPNRFLKIWHHFWSVETEPIMGNINRVWRPLIVYIFCLASSLFWR